MSNFFNLSEKKHEAQNLRVNVYFHTKFEKNDRDLFCHFRLIQVTFLVVFSFFLSFLLSRRPCLR